MSNITNLINVTGFITKLEINKGKGHPRTGRKDPEGE
jgi:hypothetical protein